MNIQKSIPNGSGWNIPNGYIPTVMDISDLSKMKKNPSISIRCCPVQITEIPTIREVVSEQEVPEALVLDDKNGRVLFKIYF